MVNDLKGHQAALFSFFCGFLPFLLQQAFGSGNWNPYFPVRPEVVMEYQVLNTGFLTLCLPRQSIEFRTEVLSESDSEVVFSETRICQPDRVNKGRLLPDGSVEYWYDEKWLPVFNLPVDGAVFQVGNIYVQWKHIGEFELPQSPGRLPADREVFESCFQRKQLVSYEAFSIHCAGVGLIYSKQTFLYGSGFEEILLREWEVAP